MKPNKTKTDCIVNMGYPTSVSDVLTFVGMMAFVDKFVPRFRLLAAPLTDWTKSSNARKPFYLEPAERKAFDKIKRILVDAPVLVPFKRTWWLRLRVDASELGVGGALCAGKGPPVVDGKVMDAKDDEDGISYF